MGQTASKRADSSPLTSENNLHRFQSNSAWGKTDVLVSSFVDHFDVKVKSETSVSGWVLKEERTNRTLSKGGQNPANQLGFRVANSFHDSYRLTLFLNIDREQVPIALSLSAPKDMNKDSSENIDDFQDNPDQPYNNMVKTFYEKAVKSYSKGDKLHALSFLKKAEELDPLQSQVQSLLEKIQSLSETHRDMLDIAKDDFNKGKKEEALAKLNDYLKGNPNNEEALELKDKIEGQIHDLKTRKNAGAKVKKTSTLNNNDRQSQADEAYNLGLESYRKDDFVSAKRFWEETLQIQPNHQQARRNLDRLKVEHPELK